MRAKMIGQSPEYYMLYEILRLLERATQLASKISTGGGSSGLPPSPTTQATTIVRTEATDTSLTMSWTRGNGASVLVVARQGSAVNAVPTESVDYTASSVYGAGSQVGVGNYVVYKGTGTSVTITGLTQDSTVHFQAFEFNGSGATSHYNDFTASGNPASTTTFTEEYQNVIDFANAA